MARVTLESKLGRFDELLLIDATIQWINLPSLYELDDPSFEKAAVVLKPEGRARGFNNWLRKRAVRKALHGDFQTAYDMSTQSAKNARRRFSGVDSIAAEVEARAVQTLVLEMLGQSDQMRNHPLRQKLFRYTALGYLKLDLALGIVTPYAQRAAACFSEGGMPTFAELACQKLYGPVADVVIIDQTNGGILKDLQQSGHQPVNMGRVPFGGKVHGFSIPRTVSV